MKDSKWKIFFDEIKTWGVGHFLVRRIKKHKVTRWLWYLPKKNYVMLGNLKLYVNKMDTVVSEKLLTDGIWEPYVTKVFLKYAKNAKKIVDLGANIGYFTMLGSKYAQVISFEPETNNFNLLNRTILENNINSVIMVKKAVGDREGKLKLYKDRDNLGDHRSYTSGDNRETETIDVTTMDKFFLKDKETIDLLKIDIQGYDVKALSRAKELLREKRIKVILGELWPEGLRLAGDSWQKYVEILEGAGFKLWEIDEEAEKLQVFDRKRVIEGYRSEKMYTMNFLGMLGSAI